MKEYRPVKKMIAALVALMVFCSSAALAEGLSSLSDRDLIELYMSVMAELSSRKITVWENTPEDMPPSGGQDETPAPRENLPLYASFREAVDAAGPLASVGGSMNHLAVIAGKDGKYVRWVTMLDDHAGKLYKAAMDAEDDTAAYEAYDAFDAYAWSLPVSYAEEFTETPKAQAELDALAGKTVRQLVEEEGFMSLVYPESTEGGPVVFTLACGLFEYAFEMDATHEEYLAAEAAGDMWNLKVKSGKLSGFSGYATSLYYHTDGTWQPEPEPGFSAEDIALMSEIADVLAAAWENGEPDRATKDALIAELTEAHPEAADMIREMVETFR